MKQNITLSISNEILNNFDKVHQNRSAFVEIKMREYIEEHTGETSVQSTLPTCELCKQVKEIELNKKGYKKVCKECFQNTPTEELKC